MNVAVAGLLAILALALFWTSGAKLLPGGALASSDEMAWATRPGLAAGTIAGVVELLAGLVFVVTAFGIVDGDVSAIVAAVGIAAHQGAAAVRASEAEDDAQSRIPNLVLGAMAMVAAVVLLID